MFGQEIGRLFGEPFSLLLGRRTYEIFAAYWPSAESGPESDIAGAFNRATKYVATRKGTELAWETSVALRDAATDVARLKQEDGPTLLTQGSTELVHALLAAGLVDEIRTFTFPLVLGKGKRLFDGPSEPRAFELTHSAVSPNGLITATYVRAGQVKTGTVGGLEDPSPAELARREKLKREG
ncbi:MAG TPA: dihydrofolate reductase family protein [Candidatus Polarisedimenticolia bacterium]|nr:dihydrofolate reductase family protein [Candidatus Polarisedimenticolia bacterium]